jgi:uncharacterized protein (DUF952 family)
MIYHITTLVEWHYAESVGAYTAPSLNTEGFIHLSQQHQILSVANHFYRGVADLVILCVDENLVEAPIIFEAPVHPNPNNPLPVSEQDQFPHIYGTINLDAVVRVVAFPEYEHGFELPSDLV